MRKVFLENIPTKEGIGAHKNKQVIDWINCVGCKVKFIYDDIVGEIEIIDYDNIKRKLLIKYLDDIQDITNDNFSKCKITKILGLRTIDFKFELNTNINNLTIVAREYRDHIQTNSKYITKEKWYQYKCENCTYIGWRIEAGLHKETNCACCSFPSKVTVLGINTIWDTARWMCDLGVSEEDAKTHTRGSQKYTTIVCPNCEKQKTIKISRIYVDKTISCSCGDSVSYPNKFAYSLLDQLNEMYRFDYLEREYSPDWIKPRKYDNYFEFEGKKYILEMDGSWHTKDNSMSGQTKERSKEIDDDKDGKADEKGIEVIRINCEKSDLEYIKNNILNSRFSKLFNLSNINWLKCEEFALSNLVKETAEIKKNNPDYTTVKIGKIMGLSFNTIINYLKKGTKLGWCDYNPKDEMRKSAKIMNKKNEKQVQIFKDKISLGIFGSVKSLAEQSEQLFKIKLSPSKISNVCRGERSHHRGFTFQYI